MELEGTVKEEGGKEREVAVWKEGWREEERREGGGRENITESESEPEFF